MVTDNAALWLQRWLDEYGYGFIDNFCWPIIIYEKGLERSHFFGVTDVFSQIFVCLGKKTHHFVIKRFIKLTNVFFQTLGTQRWLTTVSPFGRLQGRTPPPLTMAALVLGAATAVSGAPFGQERAA